MITRESLQNHLVKLWERQQYFLAPDMKKSLQRAAAAEETDLAKLHFTINLSSLEQTSKARLPLCGDTGTPLYYVNHRRARDPGHRGRRRRAVRDSA